MSSTIYISKKVIEQNLKTVSFKGKRMLEPFMSFAKVNNLPFKILEDNNIVNRPEIHRKQGDLWFCLQGKVKFICGGNLQKPKKLIGDNGLLNKDEIQGEAIIGGEEFILGPGDWLWIPPGQPHQHKCRGISRLIIIKLNG